MQFAFKRELEHERARVRSKRKTSGLRTTVSVREVLLVRHLLLDHPQRLQNHHVP